MDRHMRLLYLLLVAVPLTGAWDQACLEAGTCEKRSAPADPETTKEPTACSLYLAPSNYGGLGVYAGVDFEQGDPVGEPDVLIPVIDPNKREWSLWHTVVWDAALLDRDMVLENTFNTDLVAPGITSDGQCQTKFHNIKSADSGAHDNAGVHRKRDPSAGSFSYRYNYTNIATRPIQAGEEIFLDCTGGPATKNPPEPVTPEWLHEKALCIDGLRPGMSTIHGAGRGAFAKRSYQTGDIVTHSPVIHMDHMETIISEQYFDEDQDDIVFSNQKKGTQLMLNYCFGDKDSNILLLPTGPVVNLINHNSEVPNVAIRWSSSALQPIDLFQSTASQALHTRKTLFIEYVALKEIKQGEEIFLDYGKDWQDAWLGHTKKGWRPSDKDADYVYPAEFNYLNEGKDVRTMEEQQAEPYPSNLQTTCRYMQSDEDEVDSNENVLWTDINDGCSRPCEIINREPSADPSEGTLYTAVMENDYLFMSEFCKLYDGGVTVKNIPRNKIFWTDKAYNSDLHLQAAFRHAIGVPESFFPPEWRVGFHESKPTVLHSPIEPIELSPMVLEGGDGRPIADYAFRLGLPPEVSDGLRSFCDDIGITELFRSLVVHGNPLAPGEDRVVNLNEQEWYVQRPEEKWRSNMHWISPNDGISQWSYLQALGSIGFDKVLQRIGEYFGLDGLVCYHLTFVGVSYSEMSFLHYDNKHTRGKVFNVIVPLKLANETGPELDVQANDGTVAGYQYKYGEASLIGDNAYHGTAAVDYREAGEMRMAAAIYIADVNPNNVDRIMKTYTQSYPPKDAGLLLSKAGRHWKAGDRSKRLPQPGDSDPEANEYLEVATPELSPLEIAPMLLGQVDYAFRLKLPDQLTSGLRAYCDRVGITEKFHSLVLGGNALEPGTDEYVKLEGSDWYIQRPDNYWHSNMHWISPGGEDAQLSYLNALGENGFDEVLEAMGNQLGLDGLVCYHLTFIGVSYSQKSYIHYDFTKTGAKAYNVIIPLLLADETPPELDIRTDDESTVVGYHYRYGEASLIGDDAMHGTAAVDYRNSGEIRMAATVYIADVNPGNVDRILKDYTQQYPPKDAAMLLSKAGSHWKAGDRSKRLPQARDLVAEDNEYLEVATPELSPLEIAPMLLGQVDYAFRLKLPDQLTPGLRAYCDRVGITEKFRSLLLGGNALEPGTDEYVKLEGSDWYIQRPDNYWHSNMHWISPGGEDAQLSYLNALGENGFDEVLEAMGNQLGLDGLVCYHLTFIGVSYSQKSYIHYDFTKTGAKAYNVIIPLLLADETPPELDIRTDDESTVVGYHYRYGEASLIGDDAMHGTAAVDYRNSGEIRMAATVYIADVNPGNVDRILKDYTQQYPPKDAAMLLSKAGSHWKAGDRSKRLPQARDLVAEDNEYLEVATPELSRLEIAPMLLGQVDYAFRLKLPDQLTSGLRAYCDRVGITEKFRSLLLGGNALEPGTDEYVKLEGSDWYIQRPDNYWHSNMHWISPGGEDAQLSYLNALGENGFDEVLEAMGNQLGLDGLVCYHLTFIGVSYSQKSYIHYDFTKTGAKAYNVIIPLLLADETPPELDIRTDDESTVVGYRYRYGEASLIGDDAMHGTAAVDYRNSGEMRMAATVYIADVNPGNVDRILKDYTQQYPPKDATMLLSKAGSHWKAGDRSKRLLQAGDLVAEDNEYLEVATPELSPLEIAPMLLGQVDYAFRLKLPDQLTSGLRAYCDRVGITEKFRSLLLGGNALEPGTDEYVKLEGSDWYIQRPDNYWHSNMHWISPGGEDAQLSYLNALGENGFDEVLEAMGNQLGLDGLVCYHLTFIGVSYSQKSYIHYDFTKTGAKAYNVIIPLLLADETPPELDIRTDDESTVVGYRYRYGEASLIGDDAMHGTAAVDYRDAGEMRMAATVYIADVNPGNVDQILNDYTQQYPPKHAAMLLSKAGSHWKAGDSSKRLPLLNEDDEL